VQPALAARVREWFAPVDAVQRDHPGTAQALPEVPTWSGWPCEVSSRRTALASAERQSRWRTTRRRPSRPATPEGTGLPVARASVQLGQRMSVSREPPPGSAGLLPPRAGPADQPSRGTAHSWRHGSAGIVMYRRPPEHSERDAGASPRTRAAPAAGGWGSRVESGGKPRRLGPLHPRRQPAMRYRGGTDCQAWDFRHSPEVTGDLRHRWRASSAPSVPPR